MPELPEVETTRRGLQPLLLGKTVGRVLIHQPSLRWPVTSGLAECLPGLCVRALGRRGKYLLIELGPGTLIFHLGMSGHLRVAQGHEERRKHDHVELYFTDGSVLRFNDSRRFGALFWTTDPPLQHPRLAGLGPEPFAAEFSADYLYSMSRCRQRAVKLFLMDSSVVVGVGNIYANEALYRARINPTQPVAAIPVTVWARLVDSVRAVLEAAIAAGGTTIRDFLNGSGNPGYFRQELQVYGRTEQPCLICREPIRQFRLGQRATYACPQCQK